MRTKDIGKNTKFVNNVLLIQAATTGNLKEALWLLNLNLNTSTEFCDYEGDTALQCATMMGHKDIVEALVNHGANQKVTDSSGNTPIILAAQRGHSEIVRILAPGSYLEHLNNDGDTALSCAIKAGRPSSVKVLVNAGANLKEKINDQTPLLLAIEFDNPKCVKAILDKDRKLLKTRDRDGDTPLFAALKYDSPLVFKMLMDMGAKLETRDGDGLTPLLYACKENEVEYVRLLLAKGANPHAVNPEGKSALQLAEDNKNLEIVELLTVATNKTHRKRLKACGFKGDIPPDYICPITRDIMDLPFTASSGITFEKDQLRYIFEVQKSKTIQCPVTKKPIKKSELKNEISFALKNQIEVFVQTQEREAVKNKSKVTKSKDAFFATPGSTVDDTAEQTPQCTQK